MRGCVSSCPLVIPPSCHPLTAKAIIKTLDSLFRQRSATDMQIDLELYRRQVTIATQPLVRLSAIDIAPDLPQRTLVFLHGFGGQATQWHYQLEHFALA